MAKIRIGFSTHFEIENELAGIGTDNPTNTKQVLGNIHSTNAKVVGIATLTTPFEGFVDTKASISGLEGSEQGSLSGEIIIEGSGTVSTGATFTSGPENLTVTDSFTLPGISEDNPSAGTTRFNENLGALEFYTGVEWKTVGSYIDSGNRGRGVFGGGRIPADSAIIDYIQFATLGNAKDFGDLLVARTDPASFSNEIRGIWAGGNAPAVSTHIDYVAIGSRGNGTDFGDVAPAAMGASGAGASSSTRGAFALGKAPAASNVIHYVQIMTTGNSTDFGDLTGNLHEGSACGSQTRGIFNKGDGSVGVDYITIASTGNATDFGDDALNRTDQKRGCGSCSNSVRGFFAGGGANTTATDNSVLRYITIASTGNAFDFGDRTVVARLVTGAASQTKAIFAAGLGSAVNHNILDYVTITTLGDAMDFGDLTESYHAHSGVSDCHGGLGGF